MNTTGVIEFEYLDKLRKVDFDLKPQSYGGSPMLTIKGKGDAHHPFIRNDRSGEWYSLVNNLGWSEDLLEILFVEFEKKYQEAIK